MNQIAKTNEAPLPAVSSDPMISMIERAARDPNVDIEKLERLLVLQEKAQLRQAETAFNSAMSQAQSEMGSIAADSNNPQTRSRYASYFALDKAVRPIYSRHGFALSFDTGEAQSDSWIKVLCYVSHRDGYTRVYHVDMPADGKGAKGGDVMTKTHAVGSGMTYGQRYLLKMIFNIAIGSDDDGNAASPKQSAMRVPSPSEVERDAPEQYLGPCLLTPFKTEKFPEWADRFIAAINGAKTESELNEWDSLNDGLLSTINEKAQAVYKRIDGAMVVKRASFAPKAAPKPDPISSGPQKIPPASKREGPELFNEERFKWAWEQIKLAQSKEALDAFWDAQIKPDKAEWFPSDLKELIDCFENRQLELQEGERS